MLELKTKLTDPQADFLVSDKRANIFRGGIGSGKTRTLCIKAIYDSWSDKRWCILGETYNILKDVIAFTLIELAEEWGINYTYNKADTEFTPVGSRYPIILRSADKPDRLRGLNLDCFGIDEARNIKPEIWDVMIGRIRRSANGQGFISTTPNGRDWVYQLKQKMGDECALITQTTMNNPFLPQSYVEDLKKQYGETFARQELYADIVDLSAGLFKPEWINWVSRGSTPEGESVRYYDLAYSENASADRTSGVYTTRTQDGKFYYWGHHLERDMWPTTKMKIIQEARKRPNIRKIGVDATMSQRGYADDLTVSPELGAFVIEKRKHVTNKIQNAMAFISRAENGLVYFEDTPKAREFVEEMASFSDDCLHDDCMDACAGGYEMLAVSREISTRRVI